MTLRFKVITNSSAAGFEQEVNNFMENNNIMDVKYSVNGTSFSAFIMYCTKSEEEKEAEKKLEEQLNKMKSELASTKLLSGLTQPETLSASLSELMAVAAMSR